MNLSANDKFEIIADIFYRMTGYMAPGKDSREGHSYEERLEIYDAWIEKYSHFIQRMIEVLNSYDV